MSLIDAKRKKSIQSSYKEKMKMHKQIYDLEGEEKIKYDIGRLKSQIKNVEWDAKKIKENGVIENKLKILKQQLEEKEQCLKH